MRICGVVGRSVAVASLGLAFWGQPSALADTFQSYVVASSSGSSLDYGLTTSGTLVVYQGAVDSYLTFTPPSTSVQSKTAPMLVFDNGASCTITNTSAYMAVAGPGVCNNGFEAFTATLDGVRYELYDGPNPLTELVYASNADNILLNSVGDVAIVSTNNPNPQLNDSNILLIRAATPEPGSLALFGSGLIGVAGLVRRRWANGGQ